MPKPTIIVDTREQRPWLFTKYPCDIRRIALPAGDYSVAGMETQIALERKSLADLVGTLTRGRDRFQRELEKLKEYDFAAIIIEADMRRVAHGPYDFSKAIPASIIGSLQSYSLRYGVHVLFAGDAKEAEAYAFGLLSKAWSRKRLEEVMNDSGDAPTP